MIHYPVNLPVIVLVGPTAIGKTSLSLEIASLFDCEIISMDSMQVYRHMDIGTAKVSRQDQEKIPHHLIDIVNPDEEYDAERFSTDAIRIIAEVNSRGRTPLVTGGTGLYLRALSEGFFSGVGQYPDIRAKLKLRIEQDGGYILHQELKLYDSISAERIHFNDKHRLLRALEIYYGSGIPWSEHIRRQETKKEVRFSKMLMLGLTCDRNQLYNQIDIRTEVMIEAGLESEVRQLLDKGYKPDLKPMLAIGYRHMIMYVKGNWEKTSMEKFLARDTRRYAKRQYTWFNNINDIVWFENKDTKGVINHVSGWLKNAR